MTLRSTLRRVATVSAGTLALALSGGGMAMATILQPTVDTSTVSTSPVDTGTSTVKAVASPVPSPVRTLTSTVTSTTKTVTSTVTSTAPSPLRTVTSTVKTVTSPVPSPVRTVTDTVKKVTSPIVTAPSPVPSPIRTVTNTVKQVTGTITKAPKPVSSPVRTVTDTVKTITNPVSTAPAPLPSPVRTAVDSLLALATGTTAPSLPGAGGLPLSLATSSGGLLPLLLPGTGSAQAPTAAGAGTLFRLPGAPAGVGYAGTNRAGLPSSLVSTRMPASALPGGTRLSAASRIYDGPMIAGPLNSSGAYLAGVSAPRVAPPVGAGGSLLTPAGLAWLVVVIAVTTVGGVTAAHLGVVKQRLAALRAARSARIQVVRQRLSALFPQHQH